MCRREGYEKKTFFEGTKIFIDQSATRIQALIRQHITKCAFYDHLIENEYDPLSSELKQKLKFFRLSRITDQYTKHVNQKNFAYKKMLVDQLEKLKVRHSELMYDYERNVENLMRQRNAKLQIIIEEIIDQKALSEIEQTSEDHKVKWHLCKTKANQRSDKDCAICLQSLHTCKPLYLTSCTHVYHAACLSSFEMMSKLTQCPICRSKYEKIAMLSNKNREFQIRSKQGSKDTFNSLDDNFN